VLDLSEQTFFVAIRMFDYLLISAQFKTDKYLLVGITCMWIANKNLEIYFIQVRFHSIPCAVINTVLLLRCQNCTHCVTADSQGYKSNQWKKIFYDLQTLTLISQSRQHFSIIISQVRSWKIIR
jgi:hypothetical protein